MNPDPWNQETMAKDQNTFAKRARETEKKRKAEAKRARRREKKVLAARPDPAVDHVDADSIVP